MGIHKLTGFIEKHFTGWQRKELRGHLVIDGYNIRHHLNKCDWSHGGQFREYREHVLSFYGDLLRGGVVPIVVLDGIDYTGKKWPTIVKRVRDRIRQVHKELSRPDRKAEVRSQSIFPALGSEVYVQALMDLGIEYVVVDGEADDALVEIANYYGCPVLSSDSDFYIYNVKGGLVRLERMNIRKNLITAEVYYYQAFCKEFKFRDESVRFIIPALVGNDFWTTNVENEDFQLLLEEEELGPLNYDDHALLPYVQFASLFDSLESFVDEIPHFPYLGSRRRTKLRENCQQSAEIYDSHRVFKISDILDVTALCTSEGDPIPLWALRNYRKEHLTKHSACALVMKRYAHHVFIDDTTKESCVVISLPIRKYIYGILGCDRVTEHFRVEQQLSSEDIHSFESVSGHPLPSLRDMPRLSQSEREGLLYLLLGCDNGVLQALDRCWKLVLAATVFWYKATQPPTHLVKSLLLCFLICSGHSAELRRRFTATTEFRHGPEWMCNLHSFAQWHSCYIDAISLDKVLMLPLPVTCPSLLYDGRLVMYFSMPQNFDGLIRYFHADVRLFWKLLGVVLPDEAHPLATPHQRSYGYQSYAGRSVQQGDWRKSAQQDGDWRSTWQGEKIPAQRCVDCIMQLPGEWRPSSQQGADLGSSSLDWRVSSQQGRDWRQAGNRKSAQQASDWKSKSDRGSVPQQLDDNWSKSSRQQGGDLRPVQHTEDRRSTQQDYDVSQQDGFQQIKKNSLQASNTPFQRSQWGATSSRGGETRDPKRPSSSRSGEPRSQGHASRQAWEDNPTTNQRQGGKSRSSECRVSSDVATSQSQVGKDKPASSRVGNYRGQEGKCNSPSGQVKHEPVPNHGGKPKPSFSQGKPSPILVEHKPISDQGGKTEPSFQHKISGIEHKPPPSQKQRDNSKPQVELVSGKSQSEHKPTSFQSGKCNPQPSSKKRQEHKSKPPSSSVEHKPRQNQGVKHKPASAQGCKNKPSSSQKQGRQKPIQGRGSTDRDRPTTLSARSLDSGVTEQESRRRCYQAEGASNSESKIECAAKSTPGPAN